MRDFAILVLFIALVGGAAYFGARFAPGEWYAELRRPPLTPPGWLFGPVWSLLYLGIAVAAFLVWRARGETGIGPALGLWAVQLVLNALWSWLFFGLERPGLALVEIVTLLAVVIATTVTFFIVRPPAGWLFVPYALWVSFATYLNAGFWLLNRATG
jgi:tryptophan-rich sensory protein